jgi:hypothetical protein
MALFDSAKGLSPESYRWNDDTDHAYNCDLHFPTGQHLL